MILDTYHSLISARGNLRATAGDTEIFPSTYSKHQGVRHFARIAGRCTWKTKPQVNRRGTKLLRAASRAAHRPIRIPGSTTSRPTSPALTAVRPGATLLAHTDSCSCLLWYWYGRPLLIIFQLFWLILQNLAGTASGVTGVCAQALYAARSALCVWVALYLIQRAPRPPSATPLVRAPARH